MTHFLFSWGCLTSIQIVHAHIIDVEGFGHANREGALCDGVPAKGHSDAHWALCTCTALFWPNYKYIIYKIYICACVCCVTGVIGVYLTV